VRLNPLDIYNKEFRRGFSVWSYKKEDVDDFLEQVGRDYEEVFNEVNLLKEENEELQKQLDKCKANEKILKQDLERAEEEKEKVEKESDLIVKEAKIKAKEIIEDAQGQIQDYYSRYQKLKELEELFRVRFRTLLETHLEYLEKHEAQVQDQEQSEEETSEDGQSD